jgi:hypothetical protein
MSLSISAMAIDDQAYKRRLSHDHHQTSHVEVDSRGGDWQTPDVHFCSHAVGRNKEASFNYTIQVSKEWNDLPGLTSRSWAKPPTVDRLMRAESHDRWILYKSSVQMEALAQLKNSAGIASFSRMPWKKRETCKEASSSYIRWKICPCRSERPGYLVDFSGPNRCIGRILQSRHDSFSPTNANQAKTQNHGLDCQRTAYCVER